MAKKVWVNDGWYDMDIVVNYMDDDIRERLHRELAPCDEQYFVDRYRDEHRDKYGEEFTL